MTLKEKVEKSFEKARKRDIGLSYGSYYDGYIAGATENGIVWHDLRKNPDDLPTDKYFKITSDGYIAFYDCFLGKWYDHRSDELTCQPAAWTEIPKFEEVEELLDGK